MKHQSIMRTLIFTVLLLPALAHGQFPMVGTVPGGSTVNIATDIGNNQPLTIQNTGTVELRFCMSNAIAAGCIGWPFAQTVEAGKSLDITPQEMGATSTNHYLNVSNGGVVAGSYIVVSRSTPACAAPPDITPWVTDPDYQQTTNRTLYLCPANYNHLVINKPFLSSGGGGTIPDVFKGGGTPTAALIVGGTSSFEGTIYGTQDIAVSGKVRAIGNIVGLDNLFIAEKVGIGVPEGTIPVNTKLAVEGLISSREVKVLPNGMTFPDYVFEKDYDLMSLKELEEYITPNKHLPGIPNACEIEENQGIELGAMNVKLLEKVEELFLHAIAQQKLIEELQLKTAEIQKENQEFKTELNKLKVK